MPPVRRQHEFRSLCRLLPTTSPATYVFLSLSCLLYGASLLATVRSGGFQAPSGGFFGIFNLGAINGVVLQRLGASLPWPIDLVQPWRLVMASFLHGSLMHIGFNMWVLMDIGPQIEELYGSARYFFIYVAAGLHSQRPRRPLQRGRLGIFTWADWFAPCGYHETERRFHANAPKPADQMADLYCDHGVRDLRH
jgi:hypothetical protein